MAEVEVGGVIYGWMDGWMDRVAAFMSTWSEDTLVGYSLSAAFLLFCVFQHRKHGWGFLLLGLGGTCQRLYAFMRFLFCPCTVCIASHRIASFLSLFFPRPRFTQLPRINIPHREDFAS